LQKEKVKKSRGRKTILQIKSKPEAKKTNKKNTLNDGARRGPRNPFLLVQGVHEKN